MEPGGTLWNLVAQYGTWLLSMEPGYLLCNMDAHFEHWMLIIKRLDVHYGTMMLNMEPPSNVTEFNPSYYSIKLNYIY